MGFDDAQSEIETLKKKMSLEENLELRCLISSVAVRSSVATEEDVSLLGAGLQNGNLTRKTRLICLESLFLADSIGGFEEECRTLLDAGNLSDSTFGRCMLAAACTALGREILIDAITTESPPFPPELTFPLLRDRISSTSPLWTRLLPVAERFALASGESIATRIFAAEIASKGEPSRPYRNEFIKAALESQEPALIKCAFEDYFLRDHNAYVYVNRLTKLLSTADVNMRRKILLMFPLCCPDEIPHDYRMDVQVFIEKASSDSDELVRHVAQKLASRYSSISR